MYEIENDRLLFSSLIKINYDKRFIGIAQDFIENLSLLAGVNSNENLQISLLIEECLTFIIDKYIDCRLAAHIQLFFKVTTDKKVHIEITDIGPPIHESMIPSLDVSDEDSEAGIWFKFVRELSDEFAFINQFSAGWLIQITKNIQNIAFSASEDSDGENRFPAEREHTFGEKHIRRATVRDIPALIDLAYMTYRYSYMFKDFYNGELLKKHINEKLYDIMLVEHGSKVIGAYAVKYSDACRVSAEVGSAMVSPEYRDASAVRLLVRELNTYVRTNPQHCDFFVSTAVTSHIRSQKGLARIHNGFKPLMILLNRVPRPDFIGLDYQTGGRESGLYVYHLNHKLKVRKLYSTTLNHVQIANELIANTGNGVEVLAEFAEPQNPESRISVNRVDSLQLATISVESIGQDWFTSLSRKVFDAIVSGIESVEVTIPTSGPLPANMERMLKVLNLVFCGLSLQSLEGIDLAYCLTTKPVDFGLIKVYDPVAQKLLRHIEQSYCRAQVNE